MWNLQVYNPNLKGGARRKLKDIDKKEMNRMAKLALISYEDPTKRKGIAGYKVDKKASNNDVAVLINPKDKQIVYSIAGTRLDKKNWKRDLADDTLIFFGLSNLIKRKKELQNIIEDTKNKYPDYEHKITAHSLGATLGKKLSRDTKTESYLFNRGSSPLQFISDTISDKLNKSLISQTDYVQSDDIISSFLSKDSDIIEVERKSNVIPHSLLQFMDGGRRNRRVKFP
jgi:hypothetical protein